MSGSKKKIRRILIANRGEIARRIARTCRKMGITTVSVHIPEERFFPHSTDSDLSVEIHDKSIYLSVQGMIDAAKRSRCDAIHPGYGFLSENCELAAACAEAGLTWIGPSAEAMQSMADKARVKELIISRRNGMIPVIPGYHGADQSPSRLLLEAKRIGFPVLLKASLGGGGKGMRIVRSEDGFDSQVDSAKTESLNSFGCGDLLVEKYFEKVRHIEYQIFGDSYGNVIHLNERECSIQRRHQKVIEESPSPLMLSPSGIELRKRMGHVAVELGKMISYVGAGTVEFIYDASLSGQKNAHKFYFLEMNTRLQVEHPVTEAVLGLDLVELQIKIAEGASLSDLNLVTRDQSLAPIEPKGHSIEARLYAEDPSHQFFPSTGPVILWQPATLDNISTTPSHSPTSFPYSVKPSEMPPSQHLQSTSFFCLSREPFSLRYDSAIETGNKIGIHFDPLICKVVSFAPSRELAASLLSKAMSDTILLGLHSNASFLSKILAHPEFISGNLHTGFIEKHMFQAGNPPNWVSEGVQSEEFLAATAWLWYRRRLHQINTRSPLFFVPSGWRNNPSSFSAQLMRFVVCPSNDLVMVKYTPTTSEIPGDGGREVVAVLNCEIGEECHEVKIVECHGHRILSMCDGITRSFHIGVEEIDREGGGIESNSTKLHIQSEWGNHQLIIEGKLKGIEDHHLPTMDDPHVAQMPGKILSILVKDGEKVKKGQLILKMESMKMETKIFSGDDGCVTVNVKEGEVVQAGTVLLKVS